MAVFHTIAEHVFGIVTAVEDDNAVMIDVKSFQVFQMLKSGRTFRSKITVEGSMDDIVVKDIVNDRGKAHGKPAGRIRITEHLTEKLEIGGRVWEFDLRAINSKKMVAMPEFAGMDLAVEQIYGEIEKFLEKRRIDELSCFGESLF